MAITVLLKASRNLASTLASAELNSAFTHYAVKWNNKDYGKPSMPSPQPCTKGMPRDDV